MERPRRGAFFIFIFFENIFYRNIFSISQFTVLYPYRPAGGRQGACRLAAGQQGLICKFKKNYLRGGPWREPAAPLAGGRPPAANPLGFPPPPPSFASHDIQRAGGREEG